MDSLSIQYAVQGQPRKQPQHRLGARLAATGTGRTVQVFLNPDEAKPVGWFQLSLHFPQKTHPDAWQLLLGS